MTSPQPIPIPQGLVVVRQPYGVPVEVAVVLLALGWVPVLIIRSWWLTCLIIPLQMIMYAFTAYQMRKDPQFLKIWTGNLSLKDYYY